MIQPTPGLHHGFSPWSKPVGASSPGAFSKAYATWVVNVADNLVDDSRCHGLPLEEQILAYARSFPDLGTPLLSFFWKDRKGVLGQIGLGRSRDGLEVVLDWVPAPPPGGLTLRELDVLTLLAAGLSNREISARLSTSPRTVTTHVERIMAKWDARSRTAAAVVAVQNGWVRLPIPGGSRGCDALQVSRLRADSSAA